MKNPLLLDHIEYRGGQPVTDLSPGRVNRGGSWSNHAKYTGVSRRGGSYASYRLDYQGFRLFRTSEQK